MPTANYSAAIDTSDFEVSYAKELTWGVASTSVAYKALRLTGESLSENKQRSRPQEINPSGVVSHAITTQVGVEGSLNFALSADTFDDFIAGALNSVFAGTPGSVSNGVVINTLTIQKRLGPAAGNLWLQYTGCYVTQFQINASVGAFVEGSFTVMAKSEVSGVTQLGTSVTAAPTGRVMDTVAGVATIKLNDVAFTTPLQSIQLTVQKQGARAQYAIGSSAAQGMGRGTIDLSGTVSMYFKDFTMYDKYKSETDVKLEFSLVDNTGDGYKFTIPAASLMNPTIVAGGPDTDVMAEFQLEGNPVAGVILTIDVLEV